MSWKEENTLTKKARQRLMDFDIQQVEVYLKQHPQPTRDTLRNFQHANIIPEQWESFVNCDDDTYILRVLKTAGAPPIDGLPVVDLKDLYVRYMGHAVELEECVVAAISPNRPEAYRARIICMSCSEESRPYAIEAGMVGKPKFKCGCDDPIHIERISTDDMVDTQWVRLQEVQRDAKATKVPLSITARLQGEHMMWKIGFNERIKPIGTLRSQLQKGKDGKKYFAFWFEIIDFKRVKDLDREIVLTEEDRVWIRNEMQQPDYIDKLRASVAPHISGMEILKDCAMLTLASIGLIHPLRVLIIGDPGVAKSDIMEYSALLLPRTWYVDMSQTRGTGLTTTSVKDPDSDAWMVEPGVFAMADGSAIWIDDLQEAKDPKDITALLGVIQRGKIRYALAGGNVGEFDANCAIMIATNPKGGYIGNEENIHELLGYIKEGRPQFISRMSLIIQLRDKKTDAEERDVARSIYRHSQVDIMEQYKDDWHKDITTETGETVRVHYFGTTSLRKIFKYIIEEVPVLPMPESFEDKFVQYYIHNKRIQSYGQKLVITPRFMGHVVSVAQVWARLFGKSQPDEDDVMYVFKMLEKYMSLAAYDPKTKTIDVGMIDGTLPQRTHREQQLIEVSEMSQKEQFIWGCKEAARISPYGDGTFSKELLKQVLGELPKSQWSSGEKFNKWFQEAYDSGRLTMNKDGNYTWRDE